MKLVYLILSIIGFVGPNILITKVGLDTGNYLLYRDPIATFQGMFANDISSAFGIDLLIASLVFFIWTYVESKRLGMRKPWLLMAITMVFGLSGTLPLFLYFREKALQKIR